MTDFDEGEPNWIHRTHTFADDENKKIENWIVFKFSSWVEDGIKLALNYMD